MIHLPPSLLTHFTLLTMGMRFVGRLHFQVSIQRSGSMQEALPHSSSLVGTFGVQSLLPTVQS